MKKTCLIAGILSILAALYVFIVPGSTVMVIAWLLVVTQLIYGIGIIYGYFQMKKRNLYFASGTGTLILGIIMAVFALIALASTSIREMLAIVITIMFVVNLVINGISHIANGVAKRSVFPVVSIVLGVLLVIVGIEGVLSLFVAAITIDTFMGMGLLFYGFALLASSKVV